MRLHEQIRAAVAQWLAANPGKSRADLARNLMPDHKGNGAQVRIARWMKGDERPKPEQLQVLATETGYTFREVTAPRTSPRKEKLTDEK